MSTVLEKVRGLIALTSSDYPEEARTSAFLACKLIRENGFVVVEKLFAPSAADSKSRSVERFKIINAKFDGYCRECGLEIAEGERIAWKKGWGVLDLECWREFYT